MASLYAHNFALLPRPERSFFSLGSEATRATLPDFADVNQLRSFVERLHVWRYEVPHTWLQCKLCAVFIAFLLVVVFLIILRRMYERSFWLIRILKKPTGRVIVPNAMLMFSVIQGVFAMVFIPFLFLYSKWFESRREPPANPILWAAMTWCPLISGAVWAAWGTYFATPSSSQVDFGVRERSLLGNFFSHAITINALGLLCPVAVVVTVAGPAVMANDGYMTGLQMGQAWQTRYGGESDFTQDMVQDAQRVWFQTIASMRAANVIFICWTFHAFVMAISYTLIALRLLASIRRELQNYEDSPTSVLSIMSSHVFPESDIGSSDEERDVQGGVSAGQRVDGKYVIPLAGLLANDPSDTNDTAATTNIGNAKTGRDSLTLSQLVRVNVPMLTAAAAADDDDDGYTGWRRLLPNILMHKSANLNSVSMHKSRSKQMRELRKAFVHICVQFVAVCPACFVMGGVALLLAVTMSGSAEQPSESGGNLFEYIFNVAILLVIWCICPAGSVTMLAIALRTYEPVFSSFAQVSSRGSELNGSSARRRISEPSNGGVGRTVSPKSRVARLFGGSRKPATKQAVDHAMSTFFETHTHVVRPLPPPSSQRSLDETTEPERDVERGAGSVHYAIEVPVLPPTPHSAPYWQRNERTSALREGLQELTPASFASVSPYIRVAHAASDRIEGGGGGGGMPEHSLNGGCPTGSGSQQLDVTTASTEEPAASWRHYTHAARI